MENFQLKSRSDIHLARKIWHVAGVSLIAIIYYQLTYIASVQAALFFALLFIIADLARQQWPLLNEKILKIFHPIMRADEKNHLAGTTYMFLGVFLIIALIPNKHIVTLSLLFVAFGDPIASYIGIRYGKDKILDNKSLQGFIAAFVTCTLIFFIYAYVHELMIERLVLVSLLAGLSGAIAELLPIKKIDDNFTMPLICAIFLKILFYFFAGA
ncbi:MAG: hypothetical protein D6797_03585 [Bdellovibrio sp.]|nr:MAG: hypothetical protein D6797_03585 [Bdellovibrio sp.]